MKKILWITNQAVGPIVAAKSLSFSSGTWMDAALDSIFRNDEYELGIAYLTSTKKFEQEKIDSISYYSVPSESSIYKEKDSKNIKIWKQIIAMFRPDLIMIWGTENAMGLCAMNCAPKIPAVILIQGYLSSIYQYYCGGLSQKELRKSTSIRNIICRDGIKCKQKAYLRKATQEFQAIECSKKILVDNDWIKSIIGSRHNDVQFFQLRLAVKDLFFDRQWSPTNQNTIFCTAPGGYPLKGFHVLLKALAIVKQNIPDVVLRVPGMTDPFKKSALQKLKEDGYIHYIKSLIRLYHLEDNIVFLGRLTSDQVCENLQQSNVFIVPSAIENHSISLREAMAVGCPVIASYAGGMPETIKNGDNGFLYRFEEYEHLASLIMLLLKDRSLSEKIGSQAKQDMKQFYGNESIGSGLIRIYEQLLAK